MALRWYCFGGFRVESDGRELDLGAIRPRSRTLLRYLAAAAGRPVHREQIIDALWPELSEATAVNSLHVAVSTLRTFLEPGVARAQSRYIVRDGPTYRLVTGPDLDVVAFGEAFTAGRRAMAKGGPEAAYLLQSALFRYAGDLLPEDGAADWVVADRDRYRSQAADAAALLAELELDAGRPVAAARAARRALDLDDHHDAGWRLLIAAQLRSGDRAAAARTRHRYEGVLRTLGVRAA
ncbi:BTAD domain-containing putative transcriptional regulator [Actinoplanes sp. NPDC051851]|uniref:AfsR/SARP family transcriptional regulator n=1 Tax=Actinoplanes sp. NPDC051851 TaxID=3154753 RepID=UPI0034498D17